MRLLILVAALAFVSLACDKTIHEARLERDAAPPLIAPQQLTHHG